MLCERCKIREANIQYTEVINGSKAEHNFCAQCAKELDFGQYSAIFDGEFPLGKLLSGLLGGGGEMQKKDRMHQITCPTCKNSYEEFVKDSRFGCADCYSVFDLLISDSIKQLQGSESHVGKEPLHQIDELPEILEKGEEIQSVETELKILDAKLKNALKEEAYELAVQYRDQIRMLKAGSDTDA